MTRDEAANLLGVDANAPAATVRQRFESLHNEYHVRLTNAPTPALKKVYQRNLQDLQDACRVLVPGFEVATTQDLPAPEPIHGTELREPVRRPSAPPAPATRPAGSAETGISGVARWAFVAAAVCAAIATLFALLWQRETGERVRLQQQASALEAKLAQVSTTNERWERLLKPAPLKICNDSSRAVRITSVVAVYPEPGGAVRSVFSGSYNYPTWEVRAGGRETLSIMRGRDDDWDGTAALYSLQVVYPGVEPYLVSGLMSNHKSGCVNLAFD